MINQIEKQKCPDCNGRGLYQVDKFVDADCKRCEGTGFITQGSALSTEADRGPRNALDGEPFSVGAAELEREIDRMVSEARRHERLHEADTRHGIRMRAFNVGKAAALIELRKWLFEQPSKAPAENDGSELPMPARKT